MKHLLALMLFAVVATAQAQERIEDRIISYTGHELWIRTSDGGGKIPCNSFNKTLIKIHEKDEFGPMVVDIVGECSNATVGMDTVEMQGYGHDLLLITPSYNFTTKKKYGVSYYIPSSLVYYLKCHNPYRGITVKLLAIHGNGDLMGSCTLAKIPISFILHIGQYYEYYGEGQSGYIDFGTFDLTQVKPAGNIIYEDLYWEEYDKNPSSATKNNHTSFYEAIDHFIVSLDFFD